MRLGHYRAVAARCRHPHHSRTELARRSLQCAQPPLCCVSRLMLPRSRCLFALAASVRPAPPHCGFYWPSSCFGSVSATRRRQRCAARACISSLQRVPAGATAPKLLILMQSMTTMGRTWEACPRPQIIENLPSTTSPASLHVCLELRPSQRPTLLDQPPHLLCFPLPNVAASMLPHFACPPPPCRLFQCAGSAVSKRSHSFGELRRIVLAGLFSEREKSKITLLSICA